MLNESLVARLADLLVRLRKERRISRLQLADETELSSSVVYGAECGRDARLSTWERLFRGLGYRLDFEAVELAEETQDLLEEEAGRRWERRNDGLCAGKRRFY